MKKSVYFRTMELPYDDEQEYANIENKSLLRHLYDRRIPVKARMGHNGACAGNVEIAIKRGLIKITYNQDVDGRMSCLS